MFNITNLVGGRLDFPFMPTKVEPYVKGFLLKSHQMGEVNHIFTPTEDMELVSISVGASLYEPSDFWELYVGGDVVCETVYIKDLPEGINFMAVIPVTPDRPLEFKFFNFGGRVKDVWVNYQLLK